ncbi:GIY-YIG homing endonuclease [Salmonella phage bering]|uniref:GIY-YIG homing endonuclease n=2 Tax=Kuttervirus TaxID=2169536 RepID=A0A6G9L8I0_9CAUD|nr:hypothetical protein HYP60_gp187 [Escherichia phage EP75]YP_009887933.1 GIY-YIG homing endonuclease [Salmonella phage bering]QPI14486.1 putative GIY-YIG endonuclease [Salmonella phage GEC_vB_GOT]QPI15370.1 putative GIY-YIG endonuclease [Salmonella phage GEC_vB_N6]AVZ45069.1 hypothetical protein [Escherichia phage EP75]QIQ61885.1 GIY-YIG homing endonuclease [Salmonella phage bering]
MIGHIYMLIVGGKKYIGQTRNGVEHRIKEHLGEARRGNKTILYNYIRKYGITDQEILLECQVDELNSKEIELIKLHKTHISEGGLNISHGGQIDISGMAAAYDIETREFIGMKPVKDAGWNVLFVHSMTGIKLSEETKTKMSESQTKAWDKNKRHIHSQCLKKAYENPKCKENLRAAMNKVRMNPEYQEKIKRSLGRWFTLLSPDGEKYEIKNLNKFCQEQCLCIESFNMALAGRMQNPIPKPYRKSSLKRTNTTGWHISRK